MPAISAPNLNLLRNTQHRAAVYASPLQPRTLWAAQVNDGAIQREARTIAFDTGAGSNFTWIEEYQTVWVGSAAGLHDVGIAQVRSIASGDGGVTGTLVVEANEINWSDGDHLTFKHNYELRAMYPRLDSSFVFWKRYDIAYSDQNVDINPVCIGGPHQAGFMAAGTISFDIPIGQSYAMANGATISSRSVTVLPSAGVTVNAYAAGVITVDITVAGQYWAKCSVTDSNGKTTVTFRCLFAHDPSPASSDYPYLVEEVDLNGSWQSGGWDASFSTMDTVPITAFPDETLVLLWQKAWYGDSQTNVSLLEQGDNLIIAGYLVKDTIDKIKEKGGKSDFEIVTIQTKLANIPMYSISLEAKTAGSVTAWYEHDKAVMDAGHILFHIYYWHSTLMQVCDFLDLDSNNILRKYADLEADNLYGMGDTLVKNNGIYAHIACNKAGQMGMKRDVVYLADASRAAADVVADLEEEDLIAPLTIVHNPERRVSFIFASGFYYDGTTASPVGSTAPSNWPARVGRGMPNIERQMFSGQAHANQLSGQIFAVENNPWPEVRATFQGNYLGVLDIFNQEWWQLDILSGDTNRQIVWADQNLIVRSVTAKINVPNNEISADVVFEPEVDGEDGVPYLWPTAPVPTGGGAPDIPDPADAPNLVLTASSLYRLPYDRSLWTELQVFNINDAGQDPWWRIKQGTSAPSSAIVFACQEGDIKRSTDGGVTFATVSPDDPPNDAGDAPAPTAGDLSFMQYDGDLYTQDQHCFLATWQNGSGEWRTWLYSTDDDCSTWTAVSIGGTPSLLVADNSFSVTTLGYPTAVVQMSADKFLVAGQDDGGAFLLLLEYDPVTNSINELDSAAPPATNYFNIVNLIQMDSTTAVVVYSGLNVINAMAVSTNLDTISTGGELAVFSGGGEFWDVATACKYAVSDIWVFASDDLPTICQAQKISLSGTTLSLSGSRETITNSAFYGNLTVVRTSATTALLAYTDSTDSNSWYGRKITLSAFASSAAVQLTTDTTPANQNNQQWRVAEATTDMMVLVYETTGGAIKAVAIDTSVTVNPGTAVTVDASGSGASLTQTSTNRMIVAYNDADDSSMISTLSLSGSAITVDAPIDYGSLNNPQATNVITIDSAILVVTGVQQGVNTAALSLLGGEMMGLGMNIAKGGGLYVYATALDVTAGQLLLLVYDFPALTFVTSWSLGNANESEVTARTWWAYPYCPIGFDDAEVIVFGRLNNAAGLGTTHVLYSPDYGATMVLMEDGWGNDHCGAITEDEYGYLYLIRNIAGASAKLYTAVPAGSLDLLSTIGMPGGVNPQALRVDFFGNIIAAADQAQSVMVMYAAPLAYAVWEDITFNHGTTRPVNSVVVL